MQHSKTSYSKEAFFPKYKTKKLVNLDARVVVSMHTGYGDMLVFENCL